VKEDITYRVLSPPVLILSKKVENNFSTSNNSL